MISNYCPYFCIYLAWHPNFSDGKQFAEHIFKYIYGNPEYPLVNDISIPVQFRSQPIDSIIEQPKQISFEKSLNSATFVLVDDQMVMSDSWQSYVESEKFRGRWSTQRDKITKCPLFPNPLSTN